MRVHMRSICLLLAISTTALSFDVARHNALEKKNNGGSVELASTQQPLSPIIAALYPRQGLLSDIVDTAFVQNDGNVDTPSGGNGGNVGTDTNADTGDIPMTNEPTEGPTGGPTEEPTGDPTEEPTGDPTKGPTGDPTKGPTGDPTKGPTGDPTEEPTGDPTEGPTGDPTEGPTGDPTEEPTGDPTEGPTDGNTDNPDTEPDTNTDTGDINTDANTNTDNNGDNGNTDTGDFIITSFITRTRTRTPTEIDSDTRPTDFMDNTISNTVFLSDMTMDSSTLTMASTPTKSRASNVVVTITRPGFTITVMEPPKPIIDNADGDKASDVETSNTSTIIIAPIVTAVGLFALSIVFYYIKKKSVHDKYFVDDMFSDPQYSSDAYLPAQQNGQHDPFYKDYN